MVDQDAVISGSAISLDVSHADLEVLPGVAVLPKEGHDRVPRNPGAALDETLAVDPQFQSSAAASLIEDPYERRHGEPKGADPGIGAEAVGLPNEADLPPENRSRYPDDQAERR
jgi:hypothetical protein